MRGSGRPDTLGPRRSGCVHGLIRAHRGPGGYCRPNEDRGVHSPLPTGLARDRFDKTTKDQATAWRDSREATRLEGLKRKRGPEEDPLASRDSTRLHPPERSQHKSLHKATEALWRHFAAKHTRQGAHGLYSSRRVARASVDSDVGAAVAILVIKESTKLRRPRPDSQDFPLL